MNSFYYVYVLQSNRDNNFYTGYEWRGKNPFFVINLSLRRHKKYAPIPYKPEQAHGCFSQFVDLPNQTGYIVGDKIILIGILA